MRKYFLCLMILLITVTDGCQCGGSGGGDSPVTPIVTPEVKIGMPASQTHPSDFSLTIDVTDIVSAAGIYFRLNYDPKIIQIKDKNTPANSFVEGTFFNQGGITTGKGIGFEQNSDSCLIVGLSRPGGQTGINGSGTIMTFKFTTVSAGFTSVKFSEKVTENSLFTPLNPLESIPLVKWTNAEITVK